jgi:hypothetical protein
MQCAYRKVTLHHYHRRRRSWIAARLAESAESLQRSAIDVAEVLRVRVSVARWQSATAGLMRVSLEFLVSDAKIIEAEQGLLDLGWDVTRDLAPVTLTTTDRADESFHAVQGNVADFTDPLRVNGSVGMLQVLRVRVDQDWPRKVLMGWRIGSGRRPRSTATCPSENVELHPDFVELHSEGVRRKTLPEDAMVTLSLAKCHLLDREHLWDSS